MPRTRDPARFSQLVSTAIEVFIQRGYRRTQISDIAETMGVAKGTIYLYVESKEALFDLALRASTGRLVEPKALPVATPAPGATLRFVEAHLSEGADFPRLEAALRKKPTNDPRAELREVLRELYRVMYAHRVSIKLVDRSAADYPDLAGTYFGVARHALPEMLERYLASRLSPRQQGDIPLLVLARGIVEVIAFWAIHRHWDPAPTPIDEVAAEGAAIRFALGALEP